jgi:hypothetical protein
VFGARAVRESIVEAFVAADVMISIVWIDMLPEDNEAAARQSSQIIRDARVWHYHDPGRLVGSAIAGELLLDGAGPAWDIYLFYPPGRAWHEHPPQPATWMHQLGGGKRADPARFRPGELLVRGLYETMQRLVGDSP